MKCKILQLLLTKLHNTFHPALPSACHSPLPLCPKLPLLAAIPRQQQVEKIMKYKYNNQNNIHHLVC